VRVELFSREYPPEVYGGAGVHVEYLARELVKHLDASVFCFGKPRSAPEVAASFEPWDALSGPASHLAALRTLSIDLRLAAAVEGAQLVHSHTWYANLAGHFAKLLYGIPHVMTSHSLEPLRPWKAEQLGGGYALSCFCERTAIESADAIVAVSQGMRRDVLACYPKVDPARIHVIYNGIDPEQYAADPRTDVLERYALEEAAPYVMFVGRITRQKGVVHLLDAARHFAPGLTLVLCAGEPDTPEIAEQVRQRVRELEGTGVRVVWIEKMLPRPEVIQLLSHARAFVCPSVYEPFGIVNVEAMSCAVPVVASAVGGIPEIVVEGETGFLIHYESDGSPAGTPRDPERFALALAGRINELAADRDLAERLGAAGRKRVLEHFSWASIAEQTRQLYAGLVRS
jgi:starch synthase